VVSAARGCGEQPFGHGGSGPIDLVGDTVKETDMGRPLLALVGMWLFAGVVVAEAARPPLCTDGRFVVSGEPLLGPGGEIVVLADRNVAIGSVCSARRAMLKRQRAGTRVKVQYKAGRCTGVEKKVRLAALISDACTMIDGAVKVGRGAREPFDGAASTCGDGTVDTGAGEECDGALGCGAGQVCNASCACEAAPVDVLDRPSKSGTIAITDDQTLVVMVNPDDDSISVFDAATNTRRSKVTTGDEPSAVVLAPDSTTAWIANRAAATVVKVTGLDTATPTVGAPVPVGSEPAGLALSPTGARLFVAEYAEGRVSVIDTAAGTVVATIDAPANPRALAVTNDADMDDGDELLVVPEFFGEPNADGEAKDTGRTGVVRLYRLSDLGAETPIRFDAIDSGFPAGGVSGSPTVMTSANQLWGAAIAGGRVYLPSVSASPQGPPRFDNNVFPVVWVGDLAARAPVTTGAGTTNLAREVVDSFTAPPARFVLGDLVDIDFIPGTNVSYAVSRGADCVQRAVWNDATGVMLGSAATRQIDVLGNATTGRCQAPTGIALRSDATRAWVNCWVSRRLGVIDLTAQALSTTVEASPPPTTPEEESVQRGKRFYNTGRGRWSNAGGAGAGGLGAGGNGAVGGEGWSSCSSCHPDGLTDNVTWVFPAGPRQTTSQDGSFSHGAGLQKQRIFNHSGIFDEHHDFEANTRGVSGGLGAITTAADVADCNDLTRETQVTLPANLGRPAKEVADDPTTLCQHEDWDDIDNFVKTIRPPRAITGASAASVASGRTLFETGQCHKCHAGPGWTLSRRFFTPAEATNTALAATPFAPPVAWPLTWSYGPRNQISVQPIIPSDATGPAEGATVVPLQVACVLRNVGTFGVFGDAPATDALELKSTGTRAQGRGGYNIPSLYGLAVGAPYLHHGLADSLEDLLTRPAYDLHTNAGNANFSLTLSADPQNVADLVTFLLSIDADTSEIAPPAGFDGCP
jgi:YVTN family beta-propeller protein